MNSALQRARATLADGNVDMTDTSPPLGEEERALLERYVAAFEAYDIDALTGLIQEDATQSMPPFDLWLRGRDDIFTWWFGRGSAAVARASSRPSPRTARRRTGGTSRRPTEGTSRGRSR